MPRRALLPKLANLLRDCGTSHVSWVLACLHAAWFVLAVANMSPPSRGLGEILDNGGWSSSTLLAGRPFHFHYESLFLKLLILVDMPAAVSTVPIGFLVALLLKPLHLGFYFGSYVEAVVLLLCATCQWLLLGTLIEYRLASRPWFLRQVHRWWGILIAIILMTAFILAPVINQRSRGLGFRHGGISFR